ncbi:MAG: methyltransferase domain-containing protein [Nanoarchaeota archaeon]|nr:methyltransferase domain-containing protein [Nanoarchaeota archaeon]
MKANSIGYDVMGNVAVLKFSKEWTASRKKKFALDFLKKHSVSTVLEKVGKFKGRLRKMKTNFLAGEKTKEVLYKENGCIFRFNIDSTYFSPRLSNERIEIARQVKKGDEVLVMCAGVGPFSIVIAKNCKTCSVYSNEINREANKYAELNIKKNNTKNVELVPGDIKKVALKLKKESKKFDVIVMARPQLKDMFLKEAFMLSKKGTRIYYYDFCGIDDVDSILEKVKSEAKKVGKKIKIKKWKIAGEIAPYRARVRVDFVID